MSRERRRQLISAGSTFVIMGLLFIFMIFCGFTYKNPPDPPKKIVMVELENYGDRHSGGGNHRQGGSMGNDRTPPTAGQKTHAETTRPAVTAHQNPHTDLRSPVTEPSTPVQQQPKVDPHALFQGVPAHGQGTGHDLGAGHRHGDGLGLGDAGSGGNTTGHGRGTGNRPYRTGPNLTIDVDEQPGNRVYVEVDVNENGDVVSAKILNDADHKTTATARTQQLCLNRAKTVKYIKNGVTEYRVILFTF